MKTNNIPKFIVADDIKSRLTITTDDMTVDLMYQTYKYALIIAVT